VDNLNATDTNTERDLINSAVRIAMSDVDYRGNIRESLLTPNLMENQYDYALPNDVKADAIIDLRPQATDSRDEFETYSLVPPEEFDRRKRVEKGIYTILNDDLTRILRVSADIEDQTQVISELDGVNDPDTWEGFGNTLDTNLDTEGDDSYKVMERYAFRTRSHKRETALSALKIGASASLMFRRISRAARSSYTANWIPGILPSTASICGSVPTPAITTHFRILRRMTARHFKRAGISCEWMPHQE